MKSFAPPTSEVVEQTLRSLNREVERTYFFGNLENPHWIAPLETRNIFSDPPKPIQHDDGRVQWPGWPELAYVLRVCPLVPDDAVRVAEAIPATQNPRVYHQILEIALALKDISLSIRLLKKLIEYADLDQHIVEAEFAPVLRHWASGGAIGATAGVALAKHLLCFRRDPREKEKKARRKRDPRALVTGFEPIPRFDAWDLMTILSDGIVPLGAVAPLETGKVLIDAISDMICLKRGIKKAADEGFIEDGSLAWCRQIDRAPGPRPSPDESLVNSLTTIFKQALLDDQSGATAEQIFTMLSSASWPVFRRVGNYLAAQKPAVASAWIRQAVLEYKDYPGREYGREFVEMVRNATQSENPPLFTSDEMAPIFGAILSGPNKQRYIDSMGEHFTEEAFEERKRSFHRAQFWPFETVLFGNYKNYFDQLTTEDKPTLTRYGPRLGASGTSGFVQSKSPISKEDLGRKTDEGLVQFLNDWNDVHHAPENWLISIDHRGLAQAFQDAVLGDPARFARWDAQWKQMRRPIHLRAAIDAAKKLVESKQLAFLEDFLRLALFLAEKPGSEEYSQNQSSAGDEPTPNWEYAREGAESFLESCLKKESGVPKDWQENLVRLLTILATNFDPILDENREVFIGTYDPIGTAINTTRGQALQRITDFINWVELKKQPNAFEQIPEITSLLSRRFEGHPPLTEPEYGILGESFNRFFFWDRGWTERHLRAIFPRDEGLKKWRAAFHSYLRFSSVYVDVYATLKEDYKLALANIDLFRDENGDYNTPAEAVGHHVFSFYATAHFTLSDRGNMMEKFVEISTVREKAGLLNFIGRSLASHADTPPDPINRCRAYFELRLAKVEQDPDQGAADEFALFEPWLTATGIDASWRLTMTNRVLLLPFQLRGDMSIVKGLTVLLPSHLPQVLECFGTLVSRNASKPTFYIDRDDATAIIQAGLSSSETAVQKAARKVQDDLLRAGHLEYLSLGTTL